MKKELSESTIMQYTYFLNKYAFLDVKKPEKTMDYLLHRQIEKDKKSTKKISISYVKIVISAIMWKLRQEKNVDNSVHLNKYKKYIERMLQITAKKEIDHMQNAENVPAWSHIIKCRDDLLVKKKLKQHFLLSLYTYIAPRRIKDYLMMKVVGTEEFATDPLYNYYIWNTNKFIFFNYKTKKSYQKQVIEIPDTLKTIIKHYVKFANMAMGERFFDYKSHHPLHYILVKCVGTGVDNIRHSFINEMYKNYKIPENKVMEHMAMSMGHSLQTHLRYRKFTEPQGKPIFIDDGSTTTGVDDTTDDLGESELDGITTFDKVSLV